MIDLLRRVFGRPKRHALTTGFGDSPSLSREPKPTIWPEALPEPPVGHTQEVVTLRRRPGPCPKIQLPDSFSPEQLGPDIWLYPDAFPANLCDHLIKRYDADPTKTRHPIKVGAYTENRRCPKILISRRVEWQDEDQAVAALLERIGIHHYERIYGVRWPFADTGYEIARYEPPHDHCNPHFDGGVVTRLTSVIVYLNDVDEGGETVFIRQGVRAKPRRGSALLFPPTYTHPHYAPPPLSGPRYVIVTWFTARHDTFVGAQTINPPR